tara:strand:+ start:280 stop:1329 length:1050 start_codon:yes stop_codon:yes gene_type:complete
MKKMIVTGSSGLIGSEVVNFFASNGWKIYGIDNNLRADFFGESGDTRWNQKRLEKTYKNFKHNEIDIRNRKQILSFFKLIKPDVIVHAAAQPSHDLAASRPFDDFDVNAVGTLNLLEATHQYNKDAIFIYFSTNKVYGDAPNHLELYEDNTRWKIKDPEFINGIAEDFTIDQSKHSLFGASKLAADIMVQEYGRYFNIATCCLRGGCLTGPNHSGVELHGFLSYLIKCNLKKEKYYIYGYKGKQVRDNIHSYDVALFIDSFIKAPRIAEVYNLGGGKKNTISILESFSLVEDITGNPMIYEYVDKNREGDHICYYSNLNKIKKHFPDWDITKGLQQIFEEIVVSWRNKK